MSQNAFTPPSRPPSSASASSSASSSSSSITSANNLARVHGSAKISYGGGHDHTRPLPPPRLSEPTTAITTISSSPSLPIAPLTAPLAPLSANASFRSNNSRNSTIGGTSGTATTSNNNNNLSNNNNNNSSSNNHNNNNNNNNGTSTGRQIQSSVVASPTNLSRVPATRANNLGGVTLTDPRPELERVVNEYVETPFRQGHSPTTCPVVGNRVATNQKCLKNERRLQQHHHHHHHHHHRHNHQHHQQQQQHHEREQQSQEEQQQQRTTSGGGGGGDVADSRGKSPTRTTGGVVSAQARNRDNGARRQQSHLVQSSLSVTSSGGTVTKQPVSFTKEPSNALGSSSIGAIGGRLNDPNLSIMCDFCGRCRCESCREPPPLPSRWLCDNSCFCSAETALDYASCLCCVKGLFYHCADSGSGTDSEAGGNCADEPCSCTGPRRTARWACLGALTLVLPCLLCYWPLKGCVTLCEACYARHASQGCRCDPNAHGRHHNPGAQSVVSRDSRDPEKRLLDPVTPEL